MSSPFSTRQCSGKSVRCCLRFASFFAPVSLADVWGFQPCQPARSAPLNSARKSFGGFGPAARRVASEAKRRAVRSFDVMPEAWEENARLAIRGFDGERIRRKKV